MKIILSWANRHRNPENPENTAVAQITLTSKHPDLSQTGQILRVRVR